MKEDLNRLKIVLAEHKKTNKWLADQLKKRPGYRFKMVYQQYPALTGDT